MVHPLRLAGIAAVAVIAVSFASCSNNKGKIEGKWKVTNASKNNEFSKMKEMGITLYFEFKADGTCGMGLMADPNQPGAEGMLKIIMADPSYTAQFGNTNGKYSLGSGDKITISGFKTPSGVDKTQTNMKITGDAATMTDPDGTTMSLERVK